MSIQIEWEYLPGIDRYLIEGTERPLQHCDGTWVLMCHALDTIGKVIDTCDIIRVACINVNIVNINITKPLADRPGYFPFHSFGQWKWIHADPLQRRTGE